MKKWRNRKDRLDIYSTGFREMFFLSSFSLFLRCSLLRLNFVPFEKVRLVPCEDPTELV